MAAYHRLRAMRDPSKLAAAHADARAGAAHAGDGRGEHHAGLVQRRRLVSGLRNGVLTRWSCWRKARTCSIWARRARGRARARAARDAAVSAEEEQARLLPVLEGILKAQPHAVVSVDTYKAATARAALDAGAEIVNDVSGFTWDPAMAQVCAEFGAGWC